MRRFGTRGLWRGGVLLLLDLLLFCLALYLSLHFRQPSLATPQTLAKFFPLFFLWLGGFYAIGLYEFRLIRDFVELIGNVLVAVAFSVAVGTIYFYFLSPYVGLSPKTHLVLTVALSHSLVLVWRRIWLIPIDSNLLDLRISFLGDAEHLRLFERGLRLEALRAAHAAPDLNPTTDVVVADGRWVEENWEEARRLIANAIANSVSVVSLESFYESLYGKVSPDYAGNPAWAIEYVLPKMGSLYWKVKRFIDIVVTIPLAICTAPLIAVTYLLIRWVDRIPPIYGQLRTGHLGREFMLWKFRTMCVGADAAGPFSTKDNGPKDVTLLGGFLRRFRIDELPQLWNVLRGDMSLVGPRPEWIKEVEILEREVPHYHLRHLVPPGITGWAQVCYRATNNTQASLEKHHYDLYYLKYLSFALDLSIMLKTVKRVFLSDARMLTETPSLVRHQGARWTGNLGSIIDR